MFSTFISDRASSSAKQTFRSIMESAKTRGAIVVKDHRSRGVTMEPCSDWLEDALKRCGMRVRRVTCPSLWASRRPIKEVVFCFCNLWAMSPNIRGFLRVKSGPWVALQTEHKGFRVYERPKCNYRWFLRHCNQVWDFGFDFCEGAASMFLPTMWHPLRLMPPSCPSKTLDVVLLGQENETRRYVRRALSQIKGIALRFTNNLTPRESMGLYRTARIGLMIPRQPGNFEFHRFSAYAVSYTHVVALASPKMDSGLRILLGPMVDFVPSREAMVKKVVELVRDRNGLDAKIRQGHTWFQSQRLPLLLKDVLDASLQHKEKHTSHESPSVVLETVLNDAKQTHKKRNGNIHKKMQRLMEKLSH